MVKLGFLRVRAGGVRRDLRSFEIRFDWNRPFRFDSKVVGRFENFRIGRACPLLVVVKRLNPLTAFRGTVYRLASSMRDHTPVLFNVFEDWNEESVVPHISFFSLSFFTHDDDDVDDATVNHHGANAVVHTNDGNLATVRNGNELFVLFPSVTLDSMLLIG